MSMLSRMEVVVVTGLPSDVLCPNGLRAASKSHCPGYSLWRTSHTTLAYDSRTHQVSSADGAAPCGSTVDAVCACGAGKVKVFDEDNDTFHCMDAPPDEGCPNWDQTFDFDLRVWACVTRPSDADPKKLAERVKNCGAPTVKKYWDHPMILAINYGFSSGQPDRYGTTGCHPDRDELPRIVNEPPEGISVTYFRSAMENAGDPYSSDWHWAALTPIHESIHVHDFIRFDSCAPWETEEGQDDMEKAGYTARDFDEEGFEKWTRARSWGEYYNTFGVRAPEDPQHQVADDNKPLSCLFDR